jgi:hypothetical protein
MSRAIIHGDRVVRSELRKIKEKLTGVEKYGEAREIFKEAGLTNADEVLAHLGFIVSGRGWIQTRRRLGYNKCCIIFQENLMFKLRHGKTARFFSSCCSVFLYPLLLIIWQSQTIHRCFTLNPLIASSTSSLSFIRRPPNCFDHALRLFKSK